MAAVSERAVVLALAAAPEKDNKVKWSRVIQGSVRVRVWVCAVCVGAGAC